MAEIAAILEEGFDEADVRRVRNSLAASAIYQRDSQMSMARTFGAWVTIGGDVQDILDYPDDVRAVTAERALAAVRDVFRPDAHFIQARLLPETEAME
jgi:zinc protease